MERVTVVHELASPVTQDVADECSLNDAEREIKVRVAVSRVDRERAHFGACYDALIRRGEGEHIFAQCVALLYREHGQTLSRRHMRKFGGAPWSGRRRCVWLEGAQRNC